MEWMTDLYNSFVSAPTGVQVLMGLAVLGGFGAAKNVWNVIFPLRWVTAKSLNAVSWTLLPTRNLFKRDRVNVVKAPKQKKNKIDISSKRAFYETCKYYFDKKDKYYNYDLHNCRVQHLNDGEVELLAKGKSIYGWPLSGYSPIERELEDRENAKKVHDVGIPHNNFLEERLAKKSELFN